MTNYRAQVHHVRYWRGQIHRWSTVYHFGGIPSPALDAAAAKLVLEADDAMCYTNTNIYGGTYECNIYDADTGGVPVASVTLFDWQTPSSWIVYGGEGWQTTAPPPCDDAEVALLVEASLGLSKTGKPVNARKWYHAVPQTNQPLGAPQVSAADITKLTAQANLIYTCLSTYGLSANSPSGRLPGTPVVKAYYGNHQMPRGRRRKAPVVKASSVAPNEYVRPLPGYVPGFGVPPA